MDSTPPSASTLAQQAFLGGNDGKSESDHPSVPFTQVAHDMTASVQQPLNSNLPVDSLDESPAATSSIRGGGCVSSLPCGNDSVNHELGSNALPLAMASHSLKAQEFEDKVIESMPERTIPPRPKTPEWKGWAELENDPEVFAIILREWGVPQVAIQDLIDPAQLFEYAASDVHGVIFLSQYVPPEPQRTTTPDPRQKSSIDGHIQPWFANQISKFSCGSVALMNILMNAKGLDLSGILTDFKAQTQDLNSKQRGLALDSNSSFRDVHNSFSTKLDRMIVDFMLKEEVQKYNQRKRQEARQAQSATTKKRKRGGGRLTHKKKRTSAYDEEENGFHFVAYVEANGYVWKMDGMQSRPTCVGEVTTDSTWLNVVAHDLFQQISEVHSSGQDCSCMIVARSPNDDMNAITASPEVEIDGRQEDWAPFIEHMLRLHAEKGDLQALLNL